MRLLDRLILRELIGSFVFGVAAFTSIFFAGGSLLKIISDIVNGMPVSIAVELLALQLPSIIVLVLPMAVLLATLLAIGRLSSESEIVSLYAGGISLYRIVVGVFALGLTVSVLTFVLNEDIVPNANVKAKEVRTRALKEEIMVTKPVPLADVRHGVTNSLIYAQGGMDSKTKSLRDVNLIFFRNNVPQAFFFAKTAEWRGDYNWTLRNGYGQSLTPGLVITKSFDESGISVTLRHTLSEIELFNKRPDELSFGELLGYIRLLHEKGAPTLEEEVNLYNKIAIPFAALVFALLASSLGIRSHRGGSSIGLGLSVLIIFAYYIVWHFMSALAIQGTMHPLLGAFSANLLAGAAGLALLVRAAR
jgi:lipopolysaccharide export system permease protein